MDALVTWINSFFVVYTICILAKILMSWVTVTPMRSWSRAVVRFIDDTTGWYLNLFRRVIPPIGPLDLSPVVALIALAIVNKVVVAIVESL